MIHFDTPIPLTLCIIWLGVTGTITVLGYLYLRRWMRPGVLYPTLILRLLAAFIVLTLLLQPSYISKTPDKQQARIKILADCSGSMRTKDCDNERRRRIEVLRNLFAQESNSVLNRLQKNYSVDVSVFSEKIYPARESFSELPGNTAIGNVLQKVTGSSLYPTDPGAVLLLSDGNSNQGPAVIEVADNYAEKGIPVSSIGIGEEESQGDVILQTPSGTLPGRKRKKLDIPFSVKNTLSQSATPRVTLNRGDEQIAAREVQLESGRENDFSFSVKPVIAGTHTYKLRLENLPPADKKPSTDTAFVTARIREPETFKLLYLTSTLDWNHTFLKGLCEDKKQLRFAAITRKGKEEFLRRGDVKPSGSEDSELSGYAVSSEIYNRFDVIITDIETANELPDTATEDLKQFVDARGGGLVCTGDVHKASEKFKGLLPTEEIAKRSVQNRDFLTVGADFIFPTKKAAILHEQPGVFLPEEMPAFEVTGLKRGARPGLMMEDDKKPFFAAQHYGGGRVAYLGTEGTWRWALKSRSSRRKFRSFWTNLLAWLGASSKSRVELPFTGKRFTTSELAELTATVRNPDYTLSGGASLDARITDPEGKTHELPFSPSAEMAGRFSARYSPTAPGEYKVKMRAKFPDGETLQRETSFVGTTGSREFADTAYKEAVLRNLAAVTDGKFRPYDKASALSAIPLAEHVPMQETRINLANSWILLVLLVLVLSSEWYLRRRVGFR